MANTRQSTKRARLEKKRQAQNNLVKAQTRSVVRTAFQAITQKSKESPTSYMAAVKALSKAASKGAIPKKRAARKIARMTALAKKVNPAAVAQK